MSPDTHAKALKEARSYIPNILRVCLNDCSDSGEEADKHSARFDGIVNDAISMGEFIKANLWPEWREQALKGIKEVEEYSGPLKSDWLWPVCEPCAPLDDVKLLMEPVEPTKSAVKPIGKPKHSVTIYGASDDLIEVDGDLSEEFDSHDQPTYLLFNDGTQLKIEYWDDGIWRVNLIETGKASATRTPGFEDESDTVSPPDHPGTSIPSYSDYVTLTWGQPFKLLKHGHRKLGMPKPERAKSDDLAQQIIEYLGDRKGFDGWWHDIDSDSQNEIVNGLSGLLSGKPVESKTFVITGTLSMSRAEMKELIEEAGGYVASSVTKETNYLVVGEDPGSKVEKARKLGVKMLSETDLREMIS